MKNIILFSFVILIAVTMNAQKTALLIDAVKAGGIQETENKIIHLNKDKFIKEIFDYENNAEWKYNGSTPAIIDFYADWCKPCKMVAPTLEELQKEYGNKIQIYKINTQFEQELAAVFGISGIPAFLFIPVEGQPTMGTGALPKATFEQYIDDYLQVTK